MSAHFEIKNCRGSRIIRIVRTLFVGKTDVDSVNLEMDEKACESFDALLKEDQQKLMFLFVDIQLRSFHEFVKYVRSYTDFSDIQSFGKTYTTISCEMDGLDLTFGWMHNTQTLHLRAIKISYNDFDPDGGPGDGIKLITRSPELSINTTSNSLGTDFKRTAFVKASSDWKSIENQTLYDLYDIPVTEIFSDKRSIGDTLMMLSRHGYQCKIHIPAQEAKIVHRTL